MNALFTIKLHINPQNWNSWKIILLIVTRFIGMGWDMGLGLVKIR